MIRIDPDAFPKLWLGILSLVLLLGSNGCQSAAAIEPARQNPVLFIGRIGCTASDPKIARHLARLTEETADHQMQQLDFFPASGITAVNRLNEALACFQVSTSDVDIARVSSKLESWRKRVTAEFQSHRLRLMRSLEGDELAAARVEVLALKAFFANRPRAEIDSEPYFQWLNAEDRRLQTSSASK